MAAFSDLAAVILRRAPKFLRGPNLGRFLESYAATLDGSVQQLRTGLTFSNPAICPRELLPDISFDRSIKIYDTQPEEAQRDILSHWLQLHRGRGSHYGEIDHVRRYFITASAYPTIRIVHQSGGGSPVATWHTVDPLGKYTVHVASPSNWDWDGLGAKWARWWAVIYLPPGFGSPALWDGSATWDGSDIWDGVPADVLADLWSMFYDWKAAHSRFSGLIVTALQPTDDIPGYTGVKPFDPTATAITDFDGWTTLPLANWGSPIYTGASYTGLPTRPPWALFYNIDNG
jgi:hypothetical protein